MADQLASMQSTLRELGHPGFDVVVYEPKRVSRANIGRQRFTQADIGAPKAATLVHRINLFYGLDWVAVCANARPVELERADLVITCTDSARFRVALARYFRTRVTRALWADAGNAEARGQCVLGHLGLPNGRGEPHPILRIPHVLDLFSELDGEAGERADADNAASCSTEVALQKQDWPVNRIAALVLAELLWTLLRHGRIDTHGAQFSLNPLQITPMKIDPQAWQFYGHTG
jgi:PRTRC genetic system ThiF family protein